MGQGKNNTIRLECLAFLTMLLSTFQKLFSPKKQPINIEVPCKEKKVEKHCHRPPNSVAQPGCLEHL
jgi:hypothetical protein